MGAPVDAVDVMVGKQRLKPEGIFYTAASGIWQSVWLEPVPALSLAQLDFTHIIMGHGDVAGRDWLATFRGYVHDMVGAVRAETATGATLDACARALRAAGTQRVLAVTYARAL